jgi:hypothetical protein
MAISTDVAPAEDTPAVPDGTTPADAEDVRGALSTLMAAVDARVPFGPGFFLTHLRAFVRDRCPDDSEALPIVELGLDTGEAIDVCHIIGVSPLFVALAARDARRGGEPVAQMRTELIPYMTIRRVTIRPAAPGGAAIGFDREKRPSVLTHLPSSDAGSAETALARAAGVDAAG